MIVCDNCRQKSNKELIPVSVTITVNHHIHITSDEEEFCESCITKFQGHIKYHSKPTQILNDKRTLDSYTDSLYKGQRC